jgi:hypothetical protein
MGKYLFSLFRVPYLRYNAVMIRLPAAVITSDRRKTTQFASICSNCNSNCNSAGSGRASLVFCFFFFLLILILLLLDCYSTLQSIKRPFNQSVIMLFLQRSARAMLARSQQFTKPHFRRLLSSEGKQAEEKGWWSNPKYWGFMGAMAGWGMSGAAIYDATQQGPEVISLNMTGVLIVYSSLFTRWAFIVKPQNLLLASCHAANVLAQGNQLRRALEHKWATGQQKEVEDMATTAAMVGAVGGAAILGGPMMRKALTGANLGVVSSIAAADAGPFTVHFWAPMSKWMISGASFMDLHRPTDKISLPQYTALTATGFFFTRYSLLVTPVNYTLCSVNIALFLSSAWHLSRKLKADFFDEE